ncbi:MAG TPA: glycoside hydrolase family 125 protein [Phycisphaerae bacterium]|nr:glycoside hydrolase family 125 protein [Phycisphaerae bacterium]
MLPSKRPPVEQRTFTSPVIEQVITEARTKIADPELAWLFENCFPNTLDTTVQFTPAATSEASDDAFIITGDIHAMWLRDSTNQVWPYVPFAARCDKLRTLLRGLIHRQARCVLLDAYANAFYRSPDQESPWKSDLTFMRPGVHERKYELDSLVSVLRLATGYYAATRDASIFNELTLRSLARICDVIACEQQGQLEQPYPSDNRGYRFQRNTPNTTDSLPLEGLGNPYRRTGMSRCPFRPSDDACIFQFLIAANAMAVVELRRMADVLEDLHLAADIVTGARRSAMTISEGIFRHGVVRHPRHGDIFAYETDGFGSTLLMDDAGPPNLVGLPYLGFCSTDDEIYKNTRRFVLSRDNPYYAQGAAGHGVTSPHIGVSWIWPLGIITQAITATDDAEILACLRMLKHTHAGTGFMHEAFRSDDARRYTRDWFAWANTFFGELILHVLDTRPHLLQKPLD